MGMLVDEVDTGSFDGAVGENVVEFGGTNDECVNLGEFSGGFDFAADVPEAVEVGGFRSFVVVDEIGGAKAEIFDSVIVEKFDDFVTRRLEAFASRFVVGRKIHAEQGEPVPSFMFLGGGDGAVDGADKTGVSGVDIGVEFIEEFFGEIVKISVVHGDSQDVAVLDVDGIFDAGMEVAFEHAVGYVDIVVLETKTLRNDVKSGDVELWRVFATRGDDVGDAFLVKMKHHFVVLEVDK